MLSYILNISCMRCLCNPMPIANFAITHPRVEHVFYYFHSVGCVECARTKTIFSLVCVTSIVKGIF